LDELFVPLLEIGTTLLSRYRIDRLLSERNGVVLYEANDAARSCSVGIKIIRDERLVGGDLAFEKFKLEAWEPTVVDYGSVAGVPFFVTTEWDRRAAPPPVPVPVPPRPPMATIPLIDVDVVFEEDVVMPM
jgi:hypothetical protein